MSASENGRLLVKLRDTETFAAADARANLRPLYPTRPDRELGLTQLPSWYIADLEPSAANPWDLAHEQVAAQLGIDESAVIFAEPDLVHSIYQDTNEIDRTAPFAAGDNCAPRPQDGEHGKALGPDRFAWHLEDEFSQLRSAREAVGFREPRTRVAHVDTGYSADQETLPEHLARTVGRSFVDDGTDPNSAVDPDNWRLLFDNSGHGTGTIGILAGGKVSAQHDMRLGGAPDAEIVPLRVADSVVLLRTSALAQAFGYAVDERCDVISLSMGGLPTRVWEEAVDRAYEQGICICAAAGNHIGPTPPRTVVYPARYDRVLAVCGVMADGQPYAGLKGFTLEGTFGPDSAMHAALAAYTPNIPWPLYGCRDTIRLNGEGTSAATPQVAAAAALWMEKYKDRLPRDWRRVEAVRHALFSSAARKDDSKHFGNGVLQARAALDVLPVFGLSQSPKSKGSFVTLFRLVTGLGIDEPTPREEMFNLELTQRWLLNPELQDAVPDLATADKLAGPRLERVMEAIIEDHGASTALRKHVAARYPLALRKSAPTTDLTADVVPKVVRSFGAVPEIAQPPYRRLRVYAVDPSLATRFDSAGINEATLHVRWEQLTSSRSESDSAAQAGPATDASIATPAELGEYFGVDDTDPPDGHYGLVDLDDPRLIAQDGWAPSEGNPHFHQQMVYAVALKTVEHFERALGRPVLWRPVTEGDNRKFRRQLTLRPHALRQANAYYSPDEVALLFGYFDASPDDPGDHWPGTRVYSCLSFDIVAHETSHAVLDGMYRRFNEPTNPDVLALHEAVADIVALLQHFTMSEVLEHEIAKTRGDLETESMLGSLAIQFGRASGRGGALRDAIGRRDETGRWERNQPNPNQYDNTTTPHARGAILVAAVFDAYLAIYQSRTADLLRLATGGTGLLPNGAIHPDLVHRLAEEASKAADHVLNMAIRALDYLPPVDVTFFEYLRALITADFDLVRDDKYNYRVAFVEAFRRRGIHPENLSGTLSGDPPRTLSVETLRWQGLDRELLDNRKGRRIRKLYQKVCTELRVYADAAVYLRRDRAKTFEVTDEYRRHLSAQLRKTFTAAPEFAVQLGVDPGAPFEVEELRRFTRVSPDGRQSPQVVVSLTQSKDIPTEDGGSFSFSGGSTLIVDLVENDVVYSIGKNINNVQRQQRAAAFISNAESDPLRAVFFAPNHLEPFAALHALIEDH
jgi:hypothetical protein